MAKLTWAACTVTLDDLKPWAENPRFSTKTQAERILESFREFGQVQVVAIGPENEVYDGHQRLSALITLHGGDYAIDARRASRALTDDERRKLVVTLHTGATGAWNWDALGNWDAGQLREWGMGAESVKGWDTDAAQLRTMLEAAEAEDAEPVDDFEVDTDDVLAPFPYFGGKSIVAGRVWARFGQVVNYVEPFCGSAAVLLQCPYNLKIVTLNDVDGFISNFWRSIVGDPEAVAAAADWPVNEIDIFARHVALMKTRADMTAKLQTDETWYDAKLAGWWVWGCCAWIGDGWCSGKGPWTSAGGEIVNMRAGSAGMGVNRKLPHLGNAGRGINRQLPHLGSAGMGVNRQLPHLGNAGRGINRQFPHLGSAGMGVNRKLPHLGNAGRDDVVEKTAEHFRDYMRALQNKLRKARVTCGDWARIMSPAVTFRHGLTAIFLDLPYGDGAIDYSVGGNSDKSVTHDVREWAIANGGNPELRIAICGYDDLQIPGDWSRMRWKARKGYHASDNKNSEREVIWFSPHCLKSTDNP